MTVWADERGDERCCFPGDGRSLHAVGGCRSTCQVPAIGGDDVVAVSYWVMAWLGILIGMAFVIGAFLIFGRTEKKRYQHAFDEGFREGQKGLCVMDESEVDALYLAKMQCSSCQMRIYVPRAARRLSTQCPDQHCAGALIAVGSSPVRLSKVN